jgi:hypothetical protein
MTQKIILSQIRLDGGTQSRAQMDETTIAEYATAWAEFAEFPPVTVFYDGQYYWLADGYHRYHSRLRQARSIGTDASNAYIEADVRQGTQRDAVLFSVGANATHGLRRTTADKRRAIETLLRDPEWTRWSDREIARRVGVDNKTVAAVRQSLAEEIPQITERTVQRNGTTYTMKVATAVVERHWGLFNGQAFWQKVYQLHLDKDTILDRLQPGANLLTDLEMTKEEVWDKLEKLSNQDILEKFPVNSYVRHVTGWYFGKVRGVKRGNIAVMNLRDSREQLWTLDSCILSSFDEWNAWMNQKAYHQLDTNYSYLQEVVTPEPATIYQGDANLMLQPTLRTTKAGSNMEFVKAYRHNGVEYAECKWGGSPTRVLLSAIIPAQDYEQNAAQVQPEYVWGNGQPMSQAEQQAYERAQTVYVNTAAQTDDTAMSDLPQRQADTPTPFQPGQTVITRTGRTGTVVSANGRFVDVETRYGVHQHYPEQLTLADQTPAHANQNDMSLGQYTSEHIQELLPALNLVLSYADGDDIPIDGKLLAAAQQLLQFADAILEMVEGEIFQSESEEQSS